LPFSQFDTVCLLTPRASAARSWVQPASFLAFLILLPKSIPVSFRFAFPFEGSSRIQKESVKIYQTAFTKAFFFVQMLLHRGGKTAEA
jgi:hypothetical protein